tara:strand:+ start:48 stop:458 length:411 start_codon:yes stop_codon:yes gene_type:complete
MDSETQEHRDNEIKAIKEFCTKKNCDYIKLPKYDLDFLIHKGGKGIAFAEIKCRTHKFRAFPTQMLSFIKYNSLIKCSKWLPCYFMCQYTDGIYFIEVNEIPLSEIALGGRNNPRPERPNDVEFLIHFDRGLMKKL